MAQSTCPGAVPSENEGQAPQDQAGQDVPQDPACPWSGCPASHVLSSFPVIEISSICLQFLGTVCVLG